MGLRAARNALFPPRRPSRGGGKSRGVDVLAPDEVAGWIGPNADGTPTRLALTMGDQPLGTVSADIVRRDLADVVPGGRGGFRVRLGCGEPRFRRRIPRGAVVSLTDEETGERICSVEVEGEASGAAFTNAAGEPYVYYQKGCGFTVPLGARTDAWWRASLDALGHAFARSAETDIPVSIGYGTLLGHVREGGFVPHDDDLDVIVHCGEQATRLDASLAFARRLDRLFGPGRAVHDTNGQAHVPFPARGPDGREVTLDAFASWTWEGRYYQNFTIAGGLPASAVLPPEEARFMGVDVRVPRDPQAVLEAIYGPDWRVPDPAFTWARPDEVARFFRPLHDHDRAANKAYWEGYYGRRVAHARARPTPPSQFAAFATGFLDPDDVVVEFGCGDGRDTFFLASYGWDVLACDYSEAAITANQARASRIGASRIEADQTGDGVPGAGTATFATCNVADLRDVHAFLERVDDRRARAGRAEDGRAEDGRGRAVFYSRFFLHAISDAAEAALRAAVHHHAREGDLLLIETRVAQDAGRPKTTAEHFRRFVPGEAVLAPWTSLGWRTEYVAEGTGFARHGEDDAYVLRAALRR